MPKKPGSRIRGRKLTARGKGKFIGGIPRGMARSGGRKMSLAAGRVKKRTAAQIKKDQ